MPNAAAARPTAKTLSEGGSLPADTGLPPCPPEELDPYLDAAVECFLRFGIRKTSVQDVARVLDVNRVTVYRQVGNVDSILRLLMAREVHRHLSVAYERTRVDELNAEGLVRLLAEMIRVTREHPIVAKILEDESELVGARVQSSSDVFSRIADLISPAITMAIAAGTIAGRDPVAVAQWLARVGATCVLSPPPGDLEAFLAELLVPALTPDASPRAKRGRPAR